MHTNGGHMQPIVIVKQTTRLWRGWGRPSGTVKIIEMSPQHTRACDTWGTGWMVPQLQISEHAAAQSTVSGVNQRWDSNLNALPHGERRNGPLPQQTDLKRPTPTTNRP